MNCGPCGPGPVPSFNLAGCQMMGRESIGLPRFPENSKCATCWLEREVEWKH